MGAANSTLAAHTHHHHHHHHRLSLEKTISRVKPKMVAVLPQGDLTGLAKLKAVTELVNLLTQDLVKITLLPQQRDTALEELKKYGRDPRNADPIFTKQGIDTLTKHAFNSPSAATSRNALRCLANALLIKEETRQMLVDLGAEIKACNDLRTAAFDDEFLLSRLIFLTTYKTNVKLQTLVDQYHLADSVVQCLSRHAKLYTASGIGAGKSKARADPMADMALTETVKLLFNVTHFAKDRVEAFTPAIPPLVTLICKHDTPSSPLDAPVGPLVNAFLTLDLESKEGVAAIFPPKTPTILVDRLVQLLDLSLRKYKDTELDQTVLPLVTLLRKLYELAPAEKVQPAMHKHLLPSEEDRTKVLGKGENLQAVLLRHTTNALAPDFRTAVSHMLFELSDKDATKFVQNVGYGFASGFLFQNNVPIPEGLHDGSVGAGGDDQKRPVNAITGQFLDEEKGPQLPEMTDEEKEREAERLFVLFERLKRTGIVDVENPVAKALREGRLEKKSGDSGRVEELD